MSRRSARPADPTPSSSSRSRSTAIPPTAASTASASRRPIPTRSRPHAPARTVPAFAAPAAAPNSLRLSRMLALAPGPPNDDPASASEPVSVQNDAQRQAIDAVLRCTRPLYAQLLHSTPLLRLRGLNLRPRKRPRWSTPLGTHTDSNQSHSSSRLTTPDTPTSSWQEQTPPDSRSTHIGLPGQHQATLRLNGQSWRKAPKSLHWTPTLLRYGMESGDALSRLRPIHDSISSLLPGLGVVSDDGDSNDLDGGRGSGGGGSGEDGGTPTRAPAPYQIPHAHRKYLADQIRSSSSVSLPHGVRSALADWVEQDVLCAPSELSILMAKQVWLVPLSCPLPTYFHPETSSTSFVQTTHSCPTMILEPRVPQWVLASLPQIVFDSSQRSATYNPWIDVLGNALHDTSRECTPASSIASAHPGLGVGGSVSSLAPLNVDLDLDLGSAMSPTQAAQHQSAQRSAPSDALRTGANLPRTFIFPSTTRKGEAVTTKAPTTLPSQPRLDTGPFLLPGEQARWRTRLLLTQTASVMKDNQELSLWEDYGRTRRSRANNAVLRVSSQADSIQARFAPHKRELEQVQSSTQLLRAKRQLLQTQLQQCKAQSEARRSQIHSVAHQALQAKQQQKEQLRLRVRWLQAQKNRDQQRSDATRQTGGGVQPAPSITSQQQQVGSSLTLAVTFGANPSPTEAYSTSPHPPPPPPLMMVPRDI